MWVGLLIFYVANVANVANVTNVHFASFCSIKPPILHHFDADFPAQKPYLAPNFKTSPP